MISNEILTPVKLGEPLPTGTNIIGSFKLTDGTTVALITVSGEQLVNISGVNPIPVNVLVNNATGEEVPTTIAAGTAIVGKVGIVDSSGNQIGSDVHGSSYHLLTSTKDINGSGSITSGSGATSYVEVATHGCGSGIVIVSGTWAGKIEFQGSIDSVWATLSIVSPTGTISRNGLTNMSQNGQYRIIIVAGYTKIRAIATTYISGQMDIAFNFSTPVGTSYSWQLNADNLNGTMVVSRANVGTTNAVAPITGQDGVAGGSGVVGATTQRVCLATDVALPAGTNLLGKVGIDQTTSGTTNKVTTQLIDESGTPYGVKQVDGKPRVSSMPYTYDISEGNVTGHTAWSKVGYNPVVADAGGEDLWSKSGVYVFPTSADVQMEVVSDLATADVDIGTILFTGTCDTGGTTTSMLKAGTDFTATAAIGDIIIIEKSGTTPEWGTLTAVANGSVTFSGGLSSGGSCVTARTYQILDASAAKGAMAVKVDYLDSTYAAKTEIVILNTTTPVPLITADCFRVNSFRVIAVGTKATALNACGGNLSIMKNAGNTFSYITAGFTRARNTQYTVPLGKTLYVTQWSISGATTNNKVESIRCMTMANVEPATGFRTGNIFYTYTEILCTNATNSIEFTVPTKLNAKTDIRVRAIPFGAYTGPVTSVLRGWIE